MSSLFIYIWTRLDNILIISGILAILCAISLVFYIALLAGNLAEDYEKNIFNKVFIVFVFLVSILILIPSQKDMAMIYVIPKVANSETMKLISNETPDIVKTAIESLKETITQKETK